jgi:hypothetical protein
MSKQLDRRYFDVDGGKFGRPGLEIRAEICASKGSNNRSTPRSSVYLEWSGNRSEACQWAAFH